MGKHCYHSLYHSVLHQELGTVNWCCLQCGGLGRQLPAGSKTLRGSPLSAAFLLPFDNLGKFHIFYVLTFVGYLVFIVNSIFWRCYGYGLANEQKYQVYFMSGTILKSFLSFFLCIHFIGPAQTSDDKSKMPKTYI